jgi:hypothetical protein
MIYGGVKRISIILNISTRWSTVDRFVLHLLYPQGKTPWCPLARRLDGPQRREKSPALVRNQTLVPGLKVYDNDTLVQI